MSNSLINIIPPIALDSLTSYTLLPPVPDTLDLHHFFTPLLSAYITAVTAPPPIWSSTRTSACELCQRDWIPLTYHHLIPKSTHERVLKRGWHSEEMLGSVAWLCRACHSFVHRLAGNEELAKGLYTVDLIKEGGVDGEFPCGSHEEKESWIVYLFRGETWCTRRFSEEDRSQISNGRVSFVGVRINANRDQEIQRREILLIAGLDGSAV